MKGLALGGAAALLVLPVVVIGAAGFAVQSSCPGACRGGSSTALSADSDVPPDMLTLYVEAGDRFGVASGLLAAVGKVECDHGRNPACAQPNQAGAVGPMQFLPSTFAAWSWASGSPAPSPLDPRDAVFAAAAKLAADGATPQPAMALFAYNHSAAYVATVVAWALVYGWSPPDAGVLASAVLDHPHVQLRAEAAADVRAGLVDERVIAVVLVVATRHDLRSVGPFVTGHGYYVQGTDRPSNHAFGRAVDLPWVDGDAVSPANDGARAAAELAGAIPGALRPDEIGCPWALRVPGVRTFTEGHDDHLHVGYDA
ncbi:MAG: hypothetical protein QOF60_1235 [Actinomycetota bacterium]|nr:hypothetical protein [Actinomycetota bacterium]